MSDNPLLPENQAGNPAADVIRQKLAKIYATEPDALKEERQIEAGSIVRSTHQQFMYNLNHSGKDLAQIQTEWHNYYLSLPDTEKHKVWNEFYSSNQTVQQSNPQVHSSAISEAEKMATMRTHLGTHNPVATKARRRGKRGVPVIQEAIREQVVQEEKSLAKQHLHSLLFGLGIGFVTVLIFLFGFFNEVIIAPFIQPARASAATPLIIDSGTVAPTATPQVIIPKINVQIPLNFDSNSTNEADIENDLESGVVHYPTTSDPGQNGNSAYFGHSSNNIFNKGKYKFAFVLLHQLVPGDTFYITKDSKVYAYKVFSKTVVDPSEVGVLNPVIDHPATATLITCDPPGTSLRRLVIVGDQISPDISGNAAAGTTVGNPADNAEKLAGNGQTLWGRFISTSIGKAIVGIVAVIAVVIVFRRLSRPKY